MPSYNIHLAIAKRYIEKNPGLIHDERDFYDGSIAPDLTNDKKTTHYSIPTQSTNVAEQAKCKVDLSKLWKLPIDSDFQRGVFLHLLADYIFYNMYFDADLLQNVPYEIFSNDMAASFNYTNPWLAEKYKISYEQTSNAALMYSNVAALNTSRPEIAHGKNILSNPAKLEHFIEYMSGLDLEKLRKTQQIVF
jgi:hypothetical protein